MATLATKHTVIHVMRFSTNLLLPTALLVAACFVATPLALSASTASAATPYCNTLSALPASAPTASGAKEPIARVRSARARLGAFITQLTALAAGTPSSPTRVLADQSQTLANQEYKQLTYVILNHAKPRDTAAVLSARAVAERDASVITVDLHKLIPASAAFCSSQAQTTARSDALAVGRSAVELAAAHRKAPTLANLTTAVGETSAVKIAASAAYTSGPLLSAKLAVTVAPHHVLDVCLSFPGTYQRPPVIVAC